MNANELLKQNNRANELIFKGLVECGCFKAALELDLFTHLADEAKDVATLATLAGAIPSRLAMLLEALRHMGITAEDGGQWSLTSARLLISTGTLIPKQMPSCSAGFCIRLMNS